MQDFPMVSKTGEVHCYNSGNDYHTDLFNASLLFRIKMDKTAKTTTLFYDLLLTRQ